MQFVSSVEHRLHHPRVEVSFGERIAMYEVPDRADSIEATLLADPTFSRVEPTAHGRAAIDAVHDPRLVDFLAEAWARFQAEARPLDDVFPDVMLHPGVIEGMGPAVYPEDIGGQLGYWCWETNTPIVEGTYPAARASVDVALTALDLVDRDGGAAYGLCRPPGHHAPRAAYGGYCYFNNAAIVAEAARAGGRDKVIVLDVDYHHGNGTQQLFWRRGDVLYASLHGDPRRAYPYFCGTAEERGVDAGAGTTLNVPLAAGLDDDGYLRRLAEALDAIERFAPDLVVVSLGLDTSVGDPLGDLAVTATGMGRSGAAIAQLGIDTVVVQEGGYDLATVGRDAHRWLVGFRDGVPAR